MGAGAKAAPRACGEGLSRSPVRSAVVTLSTSAFVKLIVDESRSDEARTWSTEARLVATSVVTYPETCAALCGRDRFTAPVGGCLDSWLAELGDRWRRTAKIRVAERPAGLLAPAHALRGTDAVLLAAACTLRDAAAHQGPAPGVVFAAFDRRLPEAAEREGFATLGGA